VLGSRVSYYYEQEPGQARQPGVTPVTGETIIGRDKNWLGKCEFNKLEKFESEKTYPSHVDDHCKT